MYLRYTQQNSEIFIIWPRIGVIFGHQKKIPLVNGMDIFCGYFSAIIINQSHFMVAQV